MINPDRPPTRTLIELRQHVVRGLDAAAMTATMSDHPRNKYEARGARDAMQTVLIMIDDLLAVQCATVNRLNRFDHMPDILPCDELWPAPERQAPIKDTDT